VALKPFVKKLEDVPEAFREHYRKDEENDRYILSVDEQDGWALEDIGGLRSALGREREERRKAKEMVETLTADVANLKGELKKKTPEDVERRVTEALAARDREHQAVLESKDKEIRSLTNQVSKLMVDAGLSVELSKRGVRESMIPLILGEGKNRTRVRFDKEKNNFVLEVLGKDGYPVADRNLGHLADELKQTYPDAFSGSGASGSGASNNSQGGGGGGTGPRHRGDFKDMEEKANWIKDNGQEAFMKLPAPPAN